MKSRDQSWGECSLAELGEFRNGVNFSKEAKGSGLRIINVKDIFRCETRLHFSDLDLVALDGMPNLDRYKVRENDLFFVRSSVKRDGIGLVARADRDDAGTVHCGFVIRFRPTSDQINSSYLTYVLRSEKYRKKLIACSSGSAITNLSQDALGGIEVPVPPLQVQERISAILSTFDDLMENNTRRIAILEEMARSLYQEWFVHFRFPGHERVPLVPSALGPIPEGWEVKAASQVLNINPKIRSGKETPKAFVPMAGLSEHSMLISDVQIKETNSGARFQNGDTLLARITPCLENGKTGYVGFLPSDSDVAHGSTEFIVLRGRVVCSEFVYLLARSDSFRDHAIKSMAGATGRQRVRNEFFNTFNFPEPDQQTMARFKTIVEPMFQAILLLAKKNEKLRTTRDLLLPKLISGEIDVSALSEEPIAEAAD